MIKATDLRLNNLIQESGQICKVVLISPTSVTVEYPRENDASRLSPDRYEGIPLTPRLLSGLGFIKITSDTAYQLIIDEDIVITVNPHIGGGISVQLCVKDNWCGKPVQYVHQLQNIYLDLTGDEMMVSAIY